MIISGDSILDFNIPEFFDSHILNNSLLSMILNRDDQKFINQRLAHLNDELEISVYGLQSIPTFKDNIKQIVLKSKIFEDSNKNKIKEKGDKIKIPKRLLNHSRNFDLIYNHDDINVHLFSKEIFSIIEDSKVKESCPMISDLINYLINNFYNPNLRKLIYQQKDNKDNEEPLNNSQESETNNCKKKLSLLKITALICEKPNYA